MAAFSSSRAASFEAAAAAAVPICKIQCFFHDNAPLAFRGSLNINKLYLQACNPIRQWQTMPNAILNAT